MNYKIHEVAKLLGITPQTLRFYEQYGILTSERIGEGKYRQYSNQSVDLLMSLRKCRNCGFTVAQTAELLKSEEPSQISAILAEQGERLLRQAELERRIALGMQETAQITASLAERLHRTENRERPESYLIVLKRGDDERLSPKAMERIGTMTDWMPLIKWARRVSLSGEPTEMGFLVRGDTAQFLGIADWPDAELLPVQPCVYALVRWPDGTAGAEACLREMAAQLTEQGMELQGVPLVSTLWNLNAAAGGYAYGECWFPLKEAPHSDPLTVRV